MKGRTSSPAVHEFVHLSASDAALSEFETEEVLARGPRAGRRRRTSAVAAVATAAVLILLAAWGTQPTHPPRPAVRATGAASFMPPPAPAQTAHVLSGVWHLTSRVGASNVPRFRGLVLGYELRLEQKDGMLRGAGVKATENGRALSSLARTPISVEGSIDGPMVQLSFVESGLARTSRGAFSLRMVADDSLIGAFWSDAARSSGTVTATRAD